jgi:hypothetical protein
MTWWPAADLYGPGHCFEPRGELGDRDVQAHAQDLVAGRQVALFDGVGDQRPCPFHLLIRRIEAEVLVGKVLPNGIAGDRPLLDRLGDRKYELGLSGVLPGACNL